jgi:hypothetical protein
MPVLEFFLPDSQPKKGHFSMPSQQSHLRSVTPPGGGDSGNTSRQQARQRPSKAIPTDRIKVDRQYEVLQALGRLSGPRKETVNADRLARAVGDIVPTTVILSNRFFEAAGWITTPAKGLYAATDALMKYTQLLAVNEPDRAAETLRGPARESWFWSTLEPHFANGKIRRNEAELMLMTEAVATDSHLPMIRNLLAWLEHIGLITVDDQFIAAKDETSAQASDAAPTVTPDGPERAADTRTEGTKPTAQAGERSPAPVISLSFEVKITVDDLARLSADQITALFAAVGTVAAVKGKQ